jgi:hypothetical protein
VITGFTLLEAEPGNPSVLFETIDEADRKIAAIRIREHECRLSDAHRVHERPEDILLKLVEVEHVIYHVRETQQHPAVIPGIVIEKFIDNHLKKIADRVEKYRCHQGENDRQDQAVTAELFLEKQLDTEEEHEVYRAQENRQD